MTDPFAVAHPPTVEAAIDLLCSIVLHCWPRLSGSAHGRRVIRATSECWLNVQDQEQLGNEPLSAGDRKRLQDRLRTSARLVMASLGEHKPEMKQGVFEAVRRELGSLHSLRRMQAIRNWGMKGEIRLSQSQNEETPSRAAVV